MKTLSLKIPESLDEKLTTEARRLGTTKSAVIRGAVERFVEHGPRKARRSCYDAVKDLAGCLEGPADLSTNEKWLKDLGK